MGVSLLDNTDYVLSIDDISYIVSALEVFTTFDRSLAISENRDFDRGIQSTLSYMRDFENLLKRNDVNYVKLSYSI